MRFRLYPPLHKGIRIGDPMGGGKFRDARGDRRHAGIDFVAAPGDVVLAPCSGVMTRIGRCYADTPEYTLIEIDSEGVFVRVLYVTPMDHVVPGVVLTEETPIGYAQNIAERYGRGMVNHVHLDVRLIYHVLANGQPVDGWKVFVDPKLFLN